jgi:hypothetical protein
MALIVFPASPTNGQVFPSSPTAGQNIYQWEQVSATWRLKGTATGVATGTYGASRIVGQFTVDATGSITFAQDIPIPTADLTQTGLVQLVNDTVTNDATMALTAAQGYYLQNQIGDIFTLSPPYPNLVAAINAAGGTTGVTAGTYGSATTIPRITINAQGRITSATNVSPQVASTVGKGVVQVGTNLSITGAGVLSVPNASTTTPGVSQLVNDTSTNDPSKALTAAQGFNLQQQINALAISNNLTFAGTFDASTSKMLVVTTEGALAGFISGSNLPSPSTTNKEYFVIVTVGGSYSPPGGGGPYAATQGDWFTSNGTTWTFFDFGAAIIPKFVNYDNISGSFNGTLTAFPLTVGGTNYPPSPSTNIMVFVGGVPQVPGVAYNVSGSTITFTSPPPANSYFYATTISP